MNSHVEEILRERGWKTRAGNEGPIKEVLTRTMVQGERNFISREKRKTIVGLIEDLVEEVGSQFEELREKKESLKKLRARLGVIKKERDGWKRQHDKSEAEMAKLREETDAEMAKLREETDAEMTKLRDELEAEFATLRDDFEALRGHKDAIDQLTKGLGALGLEFKK